MDLALRGKVALVTGGNSGIGRGVAVAFARAGAHVVIAARGVEKGEETVALIRREGGECRFVKTDVSKRADVESLASEITRTYGRLDCAVNNAAIEGQKGFLDWTEDEWDATVDTNLKGVWLCMRSEIPEMLKVGGGSIVNISSVAGLIGFPMHAPYVAAKHGVHGLTKTASLEFARLGIRVNTICPGTIQTPMLEQGFANNPENAQMAVNLTPMGRVGQPEELAAAAVWLCSPQASFITGITLSVDGGWSQH
ncbi:MAG TPA: glucose 1-dehydrogenase [Nevskiaceae bacterium]|nr:glucose 1-dehydrogenase [Nevskiaceae bacterium]